MKTIIIKFYVALLLTSISLYCFSDEPLYSEMVIEKNIMIPMRDGVRLAADVYRPSLGSQVETQPLPIILHRTPYNKFQDDTEENARFFVQHGYVVVYQDVRGRYKSEGTFTKYIHEPEDGYDTVEWLAKQSYSNGKIGMRGGSYVAHVQAGAAKLNPPHLSTILVTVGGTSNGWTHAIRNHGAFALKQLTWAFSNLENESDDPVVKTRMQNEDIAEWFQRLPLKRGHNPLSISPEFEDYVFDLMTKADYDDYWKQMGVNWMEHYQQTSDIPMLHMSGWYDNYCQSALDNYTGLSKIKKSPVRLLMGPWLHGSVTRTHAGEVEFGAGAAIPDYHDEYHLRWYDHFLKGKQNGIGAEPEVRLFVMGSGDGHKTKEGRLYHGGYWKNASAWPLPETQFTNFYLHADGRLSPQQPARNANSITYTFDPENPVPTIGGSMAASRPLWEGGPFDQRERPFNGDPETGFYGSKAPYLPLATRPDVVVYQTEPLAEDMEIIGPISIKLHASSNRADTDFTAKLIDVYPPSQDYPSGFAMNLTDGILRARYRNDPAKAELMKPGSIYEFTIEPMGTANVFKKGHRIRLDISSSNFPRFDVNPNTGEALGLNRRSQSADNTIYHDAKNPSYIVLPIQAINTSSQ